MHIKYIHQFVVVVVERYISLTIDSSNNSNKNGVSNNVEPLTIFHTQYTALESRF